MKDLLKQDDPRLRFKSDPIAKEEFQSHWLAELVQKMLDIMKETGAVGVAAPQVGINKRVIVFGTAYAKRRKPEIEIPDTILLNPILSVLSEQRETGYEGCLNCGETMGSVPRAAEIEYTGYDMQGNIVAKRATGLEARILQHEVDHLDGVLFFDRIKDKAALTTFTELQAGLGK